MRHLKVYSPADLCFARLQIQYRTAITGLVAIHEWGRLATFPMDQAATLMGDGIILQQKSLEPAELSGARSTRIELDASLLRGGSIMNYGLQVSFNDPYALRHGRWT